MTDTGVHGVVVVGGGFGGLQAVLALRRAPVQVTLVDRRNFHLFQPLIYQVATADREEEAAWLTFVVIGGGPTGVEMAGQIGELARDTLRRDFRLIDTRRCRIGVDRIGAPGAAFLATIGRAAAVAHIRGVRLTGPIAWLIWLFVHLWYLVGSGSSASSRTAAVRV